MLRLRLLVVLPLLLTALGLRATPTPALAATLCPGSEQDLINAISSAAAGGTVALSCPSATTIYFDTATGHNGNGSPINIIGKGVTLDASGSPNPITFDGGGTTYLFNVGPNGILTLNTLTLQHASWAGTGAILSNGTVNIVNSTVTANQGTIESNGTLNITDSTLSGNYGGAIDNAFNNAFTGHLTITNSTFANNHNPGSGAGAIENDNGGTLTVTNSTFYGNSAINGGAILNGGSASATITHSTIAGNSVASSFGGAAIYAVNSGKVTISGSIIAGNTGGNNCDTTAPQVSDAITDGGYNLTDSNGNCALTGSTDLTNVNPLLNPQGVQNNGGPTKTVALQPGSPAIDTIPTSSGQCPATDQRGITRPDGMNVGGETTCDMGAYEYIETFPCPTSESELAQDISADPAGGGTVSLSCPSATTIYFDTANGHNGTGGPITISQSVTLDATSSPGKVTLDGGHTARGGGVRLFTVNSGVTLALNHLTMQNAAGSNSGGAIFNQGRLTITSSTISGNSAAVGAAIFSSGTVTITDSTLAGNSASNFGGAMYANNGGTVTITDSTLAGNSASTYGGAIFDYNATITITGSTLASNSAYAGGAIFNEVGTMIVGGSIIATSTSGGNCYTSSSNATTRDQGYNLTDGNGSCGLTGSSDRINTNPQLGPLQDNGGPTQTMALGPTSPAIDQIPASNTSLCPAGGTDQRGNPRPDDGETSCDIGAYESAYTATSLSAVSGTGTYGGTATLTATLTAGSTTVSGEPISFTLNGTAVCGGFTGVTCPTTNSSGIATLTNVSLTGINAGTQAGAVGASFDGDSTYNSSTGSGALTVAQASQTISFGPVANHTYGDAPFSVSATASSGLPVTFSVGSMNQCTISGSRVTLTGAGSCTVTASQSGNGNYNAAPSVSQTFSIAPASTTTTLTSSVNPAQVGQSITFTATIQTPAGVSTLPTGTVDVFDGTTKIGSGTLSTGSGGTTATITTSSLDAGSHTLTATYTGDTNYTGSSASGTQALTQTVTAPPSITSANSATFAIGTAGSFTVATGAAYPTTITLTEAGPLPSGVSFKDNGDGTATLSGTPASGTFGSYPLTITASNGIQPDATQSFTLSIQDTMGPLTSNLSVSPDPSLTPPPTIQATIDDTTTGGTTIKGAEYFIDTTGPDGSGTAMSAVDGRFDSPKEDVTAQIDSAVFGSLSAGKHTVYVHGEDADPWGGFVSITFTKNGPTIAVVKHFTAHRSGSRIAFRWHLVQRSHIAGFNLYAGTHHLNRSLITVHGKPNYTYHVTWTKHSHFFLDVLLTDGQHLLIPDQ